MPRLVACSDVATVVVIARTGAELEGPAFDVWPMGGSVVVVTRGTASVVVVVCVG